MLKEGGWDLIFMLILGDCGVFIIWVNFNFYVNILLVVLKFILCEYDL